jgi:hypothetical protein
MRQCALDVAQDAFNGRQVLFARVMRHGVDVDHRPVGNPKRKV